MSAQRTFGTRARELTFLRSHGQPQRLATVPRLRDRAAEMRARQGVSGRFRRTVGP
jgi:hypothetical protein